MAVRILLNFCKSLAKPALPSYTKAACVQKPRLLRGLSSLTLNIRSELDSTRWDSRWIWRQIPRK
jgi:hypothetical protein